MRTAATFLIMLTTAGAYGHGATNWHRTTLEDSENLTTVAVLRQNSATSIKDAAATNEVTPRLEFRCTSGDPTITARIDWRRFISSFSTEAGFKVDEGRFTWLKWKVNSSEQVTFSPSASDTQKLLDLLVTGKQLLVEISPYSEGPVTAEFNLAGLSAEVDQLRSMCQ